MQAFHWQRAALVVLILISALSLTPGNSDSRRLKYHEILVAQTATEMLERDDLLVPHIVGELRLKKPPLSYWLSIAAHRVLGEPGSSHVSELETRLPSLISGLLLILVTYGLGLLVTRDPRGGLIAAALIATSWAFYTYSRSGRPEMLYTFLCALMVLGFLWAIRRAEEGRSTTGATIVAWGALSLSLMAKGPQFPVFILLGIVLALLLRQQRLPLLKTLHPWMALPAIALPLAYFVYLGIQVDNAFSVWGAEMVQGADVPLWFRPLRLYYPLILVVSFAPWIITFCTMVLDLWKRRDPTALILATCVLVSLFLVSFAGKLRPHYILPLLPMCAALIAWSLLRTFDSKDTRSLFSRSFKALAWSQFVMVGVVILAVFGTFVFYKMDSDNTAVISRAIPWLTIAGVFYLTAGMIAKRNLAASFAALVGSILFASTAFSWVEVDESDYSETAYQFVSDVEAYLTEDQVLYLNSAKLLQYYYYSSDTLEVRSIKHWVKSGELEQIPYFIIRLDRLKRSGIQGEVLIEQQLSKKRKMMVLFRPNPRF